MPRPCKKRRVCAPPGCARFGPKDNGTQYNIVTMTLDEYESIRLIDLEGMTQEQCADQMNVARTTVQAIYGSARLKMAECLINEKELVIGGGDYVLCDRSTESHSCPRRGQGCCRRKKFERSNNQDENCSHL